MEKIGQTVGHYRILKELGAGGMGEVYLAEDTTLKRQVALKVLPKDLAANQDRLERFQLEAETLAALDHPNIVTIHTVEEADGVRFITMQLVEGKRLSDLIPKSEMPLERIFEIAIPLADALAAAHEKGVIHRDLKPGNIMVTNDGGVKVLDFGLAKLRQEVAPAEATQLPTEPLTDEGRILGTVPYMSPEQLEGKKLDARTDIFSLGVVLYEMATGERPFSGDSSVSVISSILRDTPHEVDTLRDDLPHHLGRIVGHCLEKNPERRFQSAKDVRNELEGLQKELETSGSRALDAKASDPRRSKTLSWPAVAGLIGVLVIVALVLVPGLWRSRSARGLSEGEVLLLTDFVNTTGDPVFDGTLKQALAVKLEESPFVDIFPERQVRETLRFMKLPPDERLTPELGQEVCERLGIKALATGEIGPLGRHYVITLSALDCRTGRALAREQVEVTSKEEVLAAVGQAATKVRQELGESLTSIERFDAPVEQATTSSLEALRAFSLATEARARGAEEDSVRLFRRAVEIDPNFAMAWARLGAVYSNLEESNAAMEATREAFDLRDRVSERERLYITAHYYDGVTGEIDKQVETYELWKQTYPRDWTPWNNLSWLHHRTGEFEKAAEEGLQALNLETEHPIPYTNIGRAYLNLYRLDDAKTIYDGALAKGYVYYSLITSRYEIAYLQGDKEAMAQQVRALAGKPGEARIRELQAGVAASQGRLSEARRLFQEAVDIAQRYNFGEQSAFMMTRAAAAEAAYGNFDLARDEALRAIDVARNRDTLSVTAAILSRVGATAEAEGIIAELEERFPKDTLVNAVWLPLARAAGEIERGSYGRAIEWLETARPYERRYPWVIFARAQAYLLAGSGEEAVAEFEKLLDLKGVVPTRPIHTVAYLGLARAHALAGNVGAGRKAYAVFFALLENADENLPLIEQAKTELVAL